MICEEWQKRDLQRLDADAQAAKRQKEIDEKLENAMITPRFREKTIENWNAETEQQKKILARAQEFIKHPDQCSGLIFTGGSGTGKNHLACAIAKELILKHSKTALITKGIKIFRRMKESWRTDSKETETQILKLLTKPDLLVIDEIGVQFGSNTERMILSEIIDDRHEQQRPTILLTNLTVKELQPLLGDRVIRRFRDQGSVLVFDWQTYKPRN